MTYSNLELEILEMANVLPSILSFYVCFVIIQQLNITIETKRHIGNKREYYTLLTLCNQSKYLMAGAAANFMIKPDYWIICNIQGFIKNVTGLGTFWWILLFALMLFANVSKSNFADKIRWNQKRIVFWYSWLVFIVSCILSSLPFIDGGYVQLEGWCWIGGSDTNQSDLWRMVCYYGPVTLIVLLTVFSYIFTACEICNNKINNNNNTKMITYIIYLYPIWGIVYVALGLARRIINCTGNDGPFELAVAHVLFASLSGFSNGCVYFLYSILSKDKYLKTLYEKSKHIRSIEILQNETRRYIKLWKEKITISNNPEKELSGMINLQVSTAISPSPTNEKL